MTLPEIPERLARWCEVPVFAQRLSSAELKATCAEAVQSGFAGLVLPTGRIMEARTYAEDSDLKLIAAIGFPAGTMDPDVKRYEAEAALDNGAHEIEVLIGLQTLAGNSTARLVRELRDIAASLEELPLRLCVPLHTLQPAETDRLVEVIQEIGPEWVTLDHPPGAMPSLPLVLQTLRKQISAKVQIKGYALPSDEGAMEALLNAGAMKLGLIV